MQVHLKIKVYGKVQGVGFRYFTQNMAAELSIKGFVQNEKDGTVSIEAEGTQGQLDLFLEWCYKGSPISKVSKIDVEPGSLKNYKRFEIRRS